MAEGSCGKVSGHVQNFRLSDHTLSFQNGDQRLQFPHVGERQVFEGDDVFRVAFVGHTEPSRGH